MDQDHALRTVLIVIVVLVLPISIAFRLRSEATRESLDRRQEGVFILSTLRPLGLLVWLGVLAWMIEPRWMAWSSVPLPFWLRWSGVGLAVAAVSLLLWTFTCLGKNLTDTVVTRKAHTLVQRGPYRWVRHPFYDSAALMTLSISLITANWSLLAAGMGVFTLHATRARIEEANLVARFGDGYRAYMAATGRFIPRLRVRSGDRR